MATNWETFPIELNGGLMTNLSPLQQGMNFPGSAIRLENFEPSIEGGYKKILGYNKWTTYPVPGTGLIRGVVSTEQGNVLAVRGTSYYVSVDKEDWIEKLNLGDSFGQKVRHFTFNFDGTEKVVLVDGYHKPVFFNTSTLSVTLDSSASSDVQGATEVIEYKNRLFFAKGPNLIFTAPYEESNYDPADDAGVLNVGSDIVGLIVFRDQLIIFCRDQIRSLSGSSSLDFNLQYVTRKTGAISTDSIQEVGGDILYLGPDGIRYLSATEKNNDFALARASEAIQNLVTQTLRGGLTYSSVVIRRKAQYRIFNYTGSTSKGNSLGFLGTRFTDQQPQGIAWSVLKGFKVYSTDSKQFGDEEFILFSSDDSYVYRMESSSGFDGEDIPCLYKTPYLSVNDPQLRKTFYKHTLYMRPGGTVNLTARLSFDYGQEPVQPPSFLITQDASTLSIFGFSTFGVGTFGSTLNSFFHNQVIGSGFSISVTYSESSQNAPFSLDTAILEYKTNDRK